MVMGVHKKKRRLIYQIVTGALMSIFIGDLFLWMGAKTIFLPFDKYLWNAGYSICLGLSLFGNGVFFEAVERRFISWVKYPVKSVVIAMSFHFVYSSFVIFFVNWLWFVAFQHDSIAHFFTFGWSIIISEYVIFVVIASIIYAKSFFREWRHQVVESEQLRAEAISLQYQVMQNQVNPHFLFNSLNVLGNLIDLDKERAKEYTVQLSDFYRNLLLLKDQEIVPVQKEIEFVKRYVFLQKIRFGDNFNVSFFIPADIEGELIPMSLQMLVENAVKHNEISKEHPLEIVIGANADGYILVENDLHPKMNVHSSNKIGLSNLTDRYRYLTGKEVVVEKNNLFFRVSLPLIKVET